MYCQLVVEAHTCTWYENNSLAIQGFFLTGAIVYEHHLSPQFPKKLEAECNFSVQISEASWRRLA
jgi:hypothetical protein